ncbi:MAG: LacI family DNA-binding transcriptional regulator, partial [Mycobacterium leprae]
MERSEKPRVTIRDVAERAGVSVATVSNVLSGRRKFAPETKERVDRAIRELQFYPAAAARQLKSRRTQTIGVLFPGVDLPGDLAGNPFYWQLLSAIEAEGRGLGYRVMFAQVTPDDDLAFVLERNLDGLVILGAYAEFPLVERAVALGRPLILIDSYVERDCGQVRIDDYQGGYQATQHLIALGHRRIALVTGTRRQHGVHHERYRGYRAALAEAGLMELVTEGPVTVEGGCDMASQLLRRTDPPTAIFASADNLAFGVLAAARELGLSVPGRLSVVGFDDLPLSSLVTPALTTIRQDTYEKGAMAVRLIDQAYAG